MTAPVPGPTPAEQFEDAYRELERVVEQLEAGGLGLEASLALYERGVALARACRSIVDAAEQRVVTLADEATAADETAPAF